jgi:hypothetical protein
VDCENLHWFLNQPTLQDSPDVGHYFWPRGEI